MKAAGLDMSLDDLIKKAKKKPAAAGAKKPAGQAAKKAIPAKGKAGQKPQQQQQQKAGAKGKGTQQQKQRGQNAPALKARGGIQKAGGAAGRQTGKPLVPVRQAAKRTDVRVVPRPAARPPPRPMGRPMPRFMGGGGPPPGRFMGAGSGMMMPNMMQQQPMMMMHQQQPMMQAAPMPQQQPMMQEQQAGKWPSDLFDGSVVSSKTSAKLLVSNLDHKVTEEDIKELFGTVGTIKESYIHYDRNGRSIGTATVVFQAREDALTAFNRYNNVALDNKRMAIEVVEQAVPRGTFKTLASGINVSRPQAGGAAGGAAAGGSYRGRGVPQGDMMVE